MGRRRRRVSRPELASLVAPGIAKHQNKLERCLIQRPNAKREDGIDGQHVDVSHEVEHVAESTTQMLATIPRTLVQVDRVSAQLERSRPAAIVGARVPLDDHVLHHNLSSNASAGWGTSRI